MIMWWPCVGRLTVGGGSSAVPSGFADSAASAACVREQQQARNRQRLGGWRRLEHASTFSAGYWKLNSMHVQMYRSKNYKCHIYHFYLGLKQKVYYMSIVTCIWQYDINEMKNTLNLFLFFSSLRMTAGSLCSWLPRSVSTNWTPSTRPMLYSTWCGGTRPARRSSPWWPPSVTHSWFSTASWCQKSGIRTQNGFPSNSGRNKINYFK